MKTIRVVAAIMAREGRILGARRAPKNDRPGGWEFPGGKIEKGESPEQALRREIDEELGMRLGTMWLLDTIEHDYPDFHLSMDCFVCPLDDKQTPTVREHAETRWLARDELLDVDWLAADERLVQTIGMFWDQIFASEHL